MHIPSKIAGTQKDQVVSGVQNIKNFKQPSSKQSNKLVNYSKYKHDPNVAKNTTTPEAPKAKGLKTLE